jgi:16S rRNA (adenine1518-N6/adenine1519-N6)-dimethyltransferase
MDLFEEHGFHPRTDLGQNFLIDLNIVEYIVTQAELSPRDVVLEVGAGTGSMTSMMAPLAGAVVAVELDSNMYQLAQAALASYANVRLLRLDALKNKNRLHPDVLAAVESELTAEPGRRLKLVSNLPYSVATPVVSNLVATGLPWERMVMTIQYELGLRMRARPQSSHYGALSVWLQAQCSVRMLKKLGPTVFWPRPRVNSAIMLLTPDDAARRRIDDRAFFHDYVRRLFHLRRKLLRPVLAGMYRRQLDKPAIDELLRSQGLGESSRAEELTVEQHVALASALGRAIQTRDGRPEE